MCVRQVATSRDVIRMWDIRRKELKSTTLRKFENGDQALGQITSVCVNCDGTRISLLAKLVEKSSSSHRMPQKHVYVYDCETDSFMSFDCGPKHFPVGHSWDATDPRLLACETKQMIEVGSQCTCAPRAPAPPAKRPVSNANSLHSHLLYKC
jgi:hypothetical protein